MVLDAKPLCDGLGVEVATKTPVATSGLLFAAPLEPADRRVVADIEGGMVPGYPACTDTDDAGARQSEDYMMKTISWHQS